MIAKYAAQKERYRIINNKTLEFEETIQKGREVKVQVKRIDSLH
jgi:hypothetical protein